MHERLLTRDEFRERVLARNHGLCCVPTCFENATDAHHILNRNLYTDADEEGGYFYSNGANLCNEHHWQAELTQLSVETLREYCGITQPRLPNSFTDSKVYDTWGNHRGETDFQWIKGPLWDSSGCTKALGTAGLLWKFA